MTGRPDMLRQTYFRDKHGIMFNIFYICTQNPGRHELRKGRYISSTINNIYQQKRKNEKINETISFQEKKMINAETHILFVEGTTFNL